MINIFVYTIFTHEIHAFELIHVQYSRTESDRLGYATVRLTGSRIARDLEKYTEVFTEGVKCWRIDSIGYGRTRPISLSVGSTERKSDRERLRKIHWSVYRGCKMLADRLRWTRTDTISLSFCRFDWAKSGRERLRCLQRMWNVRRGTPSDTDRLFGCLCYLTDSNSDVLKAWVYYFERHKTHRCKS